jgi:hypothetical protein
MLRIFGHKREEVAGEAGENCKMSSFISTLHQKCDQIKRMRWVEHVARMGGMRSICKTLVGKPEGKRPLGRPRSRWEDNIRTYIREII